MIITADLIDKVIDRMKSDRRVVKQMLEVIVGANVGSVWLIVHDRLFCWKVCKQKFMKKLSETQKELNMRLTFLSCYGMAKTPLS